jgi:hypothetical protein
MQKPARHPRRPPEITSVLKCQRTADPVLHSTLGNRHLQFPSTLPPSCSFMEQNAAILISVLGRISSRPPVPRSSARISDRPLSDSRHQPSTINQEPVQFLLSLRAASHKRAAPIYVTLHGLHDSNGNKKQPNSLPWWPKVRYLRAENRAHHAPLRKQPVPSTPTKLWPKALGCPAKRALPWETVAPNLRHFADLVGASLSSIFSVYKFSVLRCLYG